jgi:CRISPR-associated exonuclease Cas4
MEASMDTEALSWPEHEVVLISALEHWSYCPRQCALIHIEQTYDENLFTLRGSRVHRQAHEESVETERGVRIARGVPLWSDRLGLHGKSDIVEFHGETPYPVEYKSGSRRTWRHEAIQLCAQAMCLEEMLAVPVPEGAVYYAASRRRREVRFDQAIRVETEMAIEAVRVLLRGTRLPEAVHDARCRQCSLYDACLPDLASTPARVRGFQGALFRLDD